MVWHFYKEEESPLYGVGIKNYLDLMMSDTPVLEDYFRCELVKLSQYRILKAFALSNNCKIYDATEDGALTVFPKVRFDSLFNNK